MNWDVNEDGFDSYCVHCGAGQTFDVGWGSSTCPVCGKNADKTDEELEKEEGYRIQRVLDELDPEYHAGEMRRRVDELVRYFRMVYDHPGIPVETTVKANLIANALEIIRSKI